MPSSEELKAGQRADWDGVAEGWAKWDAYQELQTRPINEWMCRAAALSEGSRVLDLAGGSGQPAFTAASLVGSTGKVIATDIAPEMVEVIRRRATRDGATNVEARVMDMERVEFEDGSFDAVTCRWGYMFCPDVVSALAETRRVLKPGGRAVLAVWDLPAKNPWLATTIGALNEVAPPSAPPDPNALGPFRLSDRARLENDMREAGFATLSLESVSFSFNFESAAEWYEFGFDIAAPIRNRILMLDEARQAEVRELVMQRAGRFESEGRLSLPAANICAVGTR